MKKFAIGLFTILGMSSASTFAMDLPGVYFGVTGGMASSNITDKAALDGGYTSLITNDKTNSGVKVFGGYSFGQVGIELGQYDFGKFGMTGPIGAQPSQDEFGIKAFAVSAAFSLPINGTLDLTSKLGWAAVTSTYHCLNNCGGVQNTSTDSTVPIVGIGLRWKVANNLRVRLDWEGVGQFTTKYGSFDEKSSASLLSAGIEAHF